MDDMNTYGLILESVNEIKDIVTEGEGGQEDMEEKSTLALILDSVNEIKEALGGGGVTVEGLRSLSVSPVLATIPALNTLTPINYNDLTDDEKQNGVQRTVGFPTGEVSASTEYTLTATPSETWSIVVLDEYGDPTTIGNPGAPVAFGSVTTDSHGSFDTTEFVVLSVEDTSDPSSRNVPLILTVEGTG